MSGCPCASLLSYEQCCQPLHLGRAAATPEGLMRSRYSAFVLKNAEYLLASWHKTTRPESLELDNNDQWCALQVLSTEQDAEGKKGKVHFQATFKEDNAFYTLEENSNFVFEEGHWYYLDGLPTIKQLKPQRNDPCFCGSHKKYKKCCG